MAHTRMMLAMCYCTMETRLRYFLHLENVPTTTIMVTGCFLTLRLLIGQVAVWREH